MSSLEGYIGIDLYSLPKKTLRVEIESKRLLQACRVMVGKSPEEVLGLLPLMYNVCAVAQARATLRAIQRELGQRPKIEEEAARDLLVTVETAREHLLRVFLDWPQLFGLEPENRKLPEIGSLNRDFAASLFAGGAGFALRSHLRVDEDELASRIHAMELMLAESVFEMPPAEWLEISGIDELETWLQRCGSMAARATSVIRRRGWSAVAQSSCDDLPELSDAVLLERFDSEDAERFVALPEWEGHCCETTPLSRQRQQPLVVELVREFGRGLLARWIARLAELVAIPARLDAIRNIILEVAEDSPQADATTAGIAQVEAARGRLVHRVKIDGNRVTNYQILSPTEWNFHPRGLIAESLAQLNHCSAIEPCAHAVINAIDPCVGYRLRVH